MDETKERNLKLVNEYFDKLRADLLELLEKHDDVNSGASVFARDRIILITTVGAALQAAP